MSMSTYIQGIIPPDETWKKMKAVYDACEQAGVDIPKEVEEFFNDGRPDDLGVVIDLDKYSFIPIIEKGGEDTKEWYQIAVSDIPKHVKYLRFVNSW